MNKYDEVQTATCNRFNDMVDSILDSVSRIRKVGADNDLCYHLLNDIINDAKKALALHNRICTGNYSELEK